MRVRKEAMYERPHVNVKGARFNHYVYTLPSIHYSIYLRALTLNAFARKNCATVAIYLNAKYRPLINRLFFQSTYNLQD